MEPKELNEREKNILRYIVHQFILTASPVGSRNIVKKYDVGYSPATVRNIMSDLEDSGYLDHPHTSSGRIPTDKGYRFYVDSLMPVSRLKNSEIGIINREVESNLTETDELLKIISQILSSITNLLALVTYPKLDAGILEKIQIVSISSTRVLIVLSIKSGFVKTITLELSSEIKESKIPAVQALLNERLSGLTFIEIRNTFSERMKDIPNNYKPIIRFFIDSVDKIFTDINPTDKVVLTGVKNIMKQPEFENPHTLQGVIELIEDKDVIIHILEKQKDFHLSNVLVSIGSENESVKLKDYSLVTKEYKIGDISGTLGLVGPKRMEYPKAVAIVDYVSKVLTELLKGTVSK